MQQNFIVCALVLCVSQSTIAAGEAQIQDLPQNIDVSALTEIPNIEALPFSGINKRSLELQNEVASIKDGADLDTAETLVFRPFFRSRYLTNRRRPYYRRRFYRSVDDPNDDLTTDETLVFRPFFGRRFGYGGRHFPYYYYY